MAKAILMRKREVHAKPVFSRIPTRFLTVNGPTGGWESIAEAECISLCKLEDTIPCSDYPTAYKAVVNWLEKFEFIAAAPDVKVEDTHRSESKALKQLEPVFVSNKSMPDVSILYKDRPVLLFEVDSSLYYQSLEHMIFNLVEQLRWVRNVNPEVVKVAGYVLPKEAVESCACKVEVSWEKIHFFASCKPLKSDPAVWGDEVKTTFQQQLDAVRELEDPLTFPHALPLSSDGLALFAEDAFQVPSKLSIVVCSEEERMMYKCIINYDEFLSMMRLQHSFSASDDKPYQLPLDMKPFDEKAFFTYRLLDGPLTRSEARHCIHEFANGVQKALQALHLDLKLAHVNVRLENVCYRGDQAVLIDLDRARKVDYKTVSLKYANSPQGKPSVMYQRPDGMSNDFTVEQSDWRQFAYMLYFCATTKHHDDYHKMDIESQGEEFDELIDRLLKGENPGEIKRSIFEDGGESLKSVLERRKRASSVAAE